MQMQHDVDSHNVEIQGAVQPELPKQHPQTPHAPAVVVVQEPFQPRVTETRDSYRIWRKI